MSGYEWFAPVYDAWAADMTEDVDYYVALAFWKLAIILEGVFARYAAGQYGKDEEGYQQFAKVVERLAEGADQAERRSR